MRVGTPFLAAATCIATLVRLPSYLTNRSDRSRTTPMLVDLVRGFRQLVYPVVCARCEVLVDRAGDDFCADCAAALTADPHFSCPRCTSTVGEHADVSDG